jgi:hypothetical protein
MGFLINKNINPYISARPHLLAAQVRISKLDYAFLTRDYSYIDCSKLLPFETAELERRQDILDQIKGEIQRVVEGSLVIETFYKRLICGK